MSNWFDETPEDRRQIAAELAMLRATERVCEALEERGVTRTELARRLGVAPSEITQRLRGTRNMTLASVAEMLDVLGFDLEITALDRRVEAARPRWTSEHRMPGIGATRYTSTGIHLHAAHGLKDLKDSA